MQITPICCRIMDKLMAGVLSETIDLQIYMCSFLFFRNLARGIVTQRRGNRKENTMLIWSMNELSLANLKN